MSGHVKQGRGSAVAPAKDLDRRYMQAWLAKMPQPAPQVIGVDELPIKKGHPYRIVVSDLERGCPIWVGGRDGPKPIWIGSFSTWAPKRRLGFSWP